MKEASPMAKTKETSSLNREELYSLAVETAEKGNKQSARVMFRKILGEDKRNTRAMLWLAKIAGSEKERVMWLNKILDVNPSHDGALTALNKMKRKGVVERNQLLLRIGVVGYGVILLVLAVLMILSAAS
jgi:hypothetical protein